MDCESREDGRLNAQQMAADKSGLCYLAYDRRCNNSISPFHNAYSTVETDSGILDAVDVQKRRRVDRDVKQGELTTGGD